MVSNLNPTCCFSADTSGAQGLVSVWFLTSGYALINAQGCVCVLLWQLIGGTEVKPTFLPHWPFTYTPPRHLMWLTLGGERASVHSRALGGTTRAHPDLPIGEQQAWSLSFPRWVGVGSLSPQSIYHAVWSEGRDWRGD